MASASMDRLLRASRLAQGAMASANARINDFRADRSIGLTRPDAERLDGKLKSGRARGTGGVAKATNLSRMLDRRAPMLRHAKGDAFDAEGMHFDARQRTVVKIHYFNHGGGGGAALKAHARYVARDAGGREDGEEALLSPEQRTGREDEIERGRAHADYLSRVPGSTSPFYDSTAEGVDGAARAADWAARDKRHFRLILAPERGELIADLPAYTREVMARAEAQLGACLSWVAVDHHDTDNPHTHLILRGRRADGKDLILPKDFVRHGLHDIARDVATEWLGPRSAADERLALEAEIIRHAPTRLDRMIAGQLPDDGRVRAAKLEAPNGDPALTQALKARAKELARMGLATEEKRRGMGAKVLAFQPDWQDRLKAMELHLNVRKRLMVERTAQRQAELERAMKRLTRGVER
jgi:type IV secretory pathway VirD2 relaxase